jgi:predicted oxidoreductase
MQHIKLHPSGPTFSRLVAGVWRWQHQSVENTGKLIQAALELGITTFDLADIYGEYGNEKLFGDALRKQPQLKKDMQIVTKCGIMLQSAKKPEHFVKHYSTTTDHIIKSADKSLELIGVDHLDLLLIHRPDPLMNVDQVAEAFTALKKAGKVLHFGVSNHSNSQFELLQSALSFPLVTNQIEMSVFHTEYFFNGTVDFLYRNKISPMAWSPIGGGKTFKDGDEKTQRVKNTLFQMAPKYNNAPISALLLAWLLHHPCQVFPVVGTTKPERYKEAVASLDITLDKQDWFLLLKAVNNVDVP